MKITGHKGLNGGTFVRFGIAWANTLLKKSSNTGKDWGIYDEERLGELCEAFEAAIRDNTAYGSYNAIRPLCGEYITGRLAAADKLKVPPTTGGHASSSSTTSATSDVHRAMKRPVDGHEKLLELRRQEKRRRLDEREVGGMVNLDSSDEE